MLSPDLCKKLKRGGRFLSSNGSWGFWETDSRKSKAPLLAHTTREKWGTLSVIALRGRDALATAGEGVGVTTSRRQLLLA